MIQRLNIFLLSLILAFAPAYAFANAASALGGWSIGAITASAGQATINASKSIGGQVVKSWAKVSPSVADLSRNIVRVGAVAAVTTAIDLLLDGVDWVLDPANNRVVYSVPIPGSEGWNNAGIGTFASPSAACSAALSYYNRTASQAYIAVKANPTISNAGKTLTCTLVNDANQTRQIYTFGYIVGTGTKEEKYLPYDAVSARIASDAAAGDPAANDFVSDTVAADVAEAEQGKPLAYPSVPNQLDTNAGSDAPPTTDNPPIDPPVDPADPPPFSLPGFCSWAAFVCNAFGISNANSGKVATNTTRIATDTESVKTATQTTAIQAEETKKEVKAGNTQAHTDAEAIKKEQEKTNTKIDEALANPTEQTNTQFDFPETPSVTPNTQITFTSNCPAPYTLVDSNWLGIPIRWQIDFSKFCWGMTTFVKPVVIAMASFQAVRIVTGQNDNG